MPNATVVAPPYVFVAVRIVVPVPCCLTVPPPLITFATVIRLLRLKMSAPLSVTLPLPSVPIVPPLPTWIVPAAMFVIPW